MSIPVELTELSTAVSKFPFAYLLTVSDDGRPHAVAVTPAASGAELAVETGRRSTANAAARAKVSLVFPPSEPGGYSLIVDASARLNEEGMTLVAEKAVLHRPAPAGVEAEAGSCGADCVPVALPASS
jgi:Pyridoxamine 5'-phosphate oxidase